MSFISYYRLANYWRPMESEEGVWAIVNLHVDGILQHLSKSLTVFR